MINGYAADIVFVVVCLIALAIALKHTD